MVQRPAHSHSHDGSKKTGRTIRILLFYAGIGLLILAVYTTVELVQLRISGHETQGLVIRQEIKEETIEERVNGRDVTVDIKSYYAVVSFRTGEGSHTIVSYDAGRNAPLYPTDSQVTVVYRPGHPERARIQREISGFRGIFGPLMLVVFGAALVGISYLLKFF